MESQQLRCLQDRTGACRALGGLWWVHPAQRIGPRGPKTDGNDIRESPTFKTSIHDGIEGVPVHCWPLLVSSQQSWAT